MLYTPLMFIFITLPTISILFHSIPYMYSSSHIIQITLQTRQTRLDYLPQLNQPSTHSTESLRQF